MSKEVVKLKQNEVKVPSGKVIKIKEMSIDEVDFCNDIPSFVYGDDGEISSIKGISKSRTAWLRRGIKGGDFNNFKASSKGLAEDSVLRQLDEEDKNFLMTKIQEFQRLGE
tara:strand:+ start:245 stop:577 length:333 start_codon:yes stop_codon:yes gene_type:complete